MLRCLAGEYNGMHRNVHDSIELAIVSLRARGRLCFGEVLRGATFIFNSLKCCTGAADSLCWMSFSLSFRSKRVAPHHSCLIEASLKASSFATWCL